MNSLLEVAATMGGAVTAAPSSSWLIPVLLAAVAYFQYGEITLPKINDLPIEQVNETYDFIIVGAGSAGSVVANRLTESGKWNVLLLEAGGEATDLSEVPFMAALGQAGEMDWQYKVEPDGKSCLAMIDGRCKWPRGKVLGGSSVLNFMVYLRGHKHDYDNWEAMGNTGWGYKDALKYFKKSQDNTDPNFSGSSYHSRGGPLTVSTPKFPNPHIDGFLAAGVEMGYKVRDINGKEAAGFMTAQGTTRNGTRCSTAKAFLRPASQRSNLHISMHSHVTRVLIDPKTKQAFGVEFVKNNKYYQVKASKEVILSGGSINSPQLLMLSGVGPKDELLKQQIPVIKNLSVGKNLQDHIGMSFTIFSNQSLSEIDPDKQNLLNILQYATKREGVFATLGGNQGVAYVNTKYANKSLDWPDIEFHFLPTPFVSSGLTEGIGLNSEYTDALLGEFSGKSSWTIIPILLRPKSTGSIMLKSGSPFDHPLIYANYLSDDTDLKTLVEGIKLVLDLSKTKALQRLGSTPSTVKWPGCKNFELYSDKYIGCMIKHLTMTSYHPAGTCKMGPKSDKTAVVDPKLKVYGIKGLRVIDASIMPKIVSSNLNAAVVMIGEKGSDLIKKDWK